MKLLINNDRRTQNKHHTMTILQLTLTAPHNIITFLSKVQQYKFAGLPLFAHVNVQ